MGTAALSAKCQLLKSYMFTSNLGPLSLFPVPFRLTGPSGYLTDGPGNYKYKTKCTWLIEGQ